MGSPNVPTKGAMEQARADAERLAADPDDQAEMLANQRYLGVTE